MQAADYIQFAVALIFVIGLIGMLAVILRRFGGGGIAMPRYKPGQKRRLHIVDALPLDPRRRLVLVRRDDVEHLIVLGPQSETVVESAIPARNAELGPDQQDGDSGLTQRFDAVVRRLIRQPSLSANEGPANEEPANAAPAAPGPNAPGKSGSEGRQ
ncbi:MAG: flagellar biosynthetic protein FliO [Alphaproteobacteria bacterium]